MASTAAVRLRASGSAIPVPRGLSQRQSNFAAVSPLTIAKPSVLLQRREKAAGLREGLTVASAEKRDGLGAQQRWRAAKFAVADKRDEMQAWLMSRTLVTSLIAWWAAAVLPRYRAVSTAVSKVYSNEARRYNEFLSNETKLVWMWKKTTGQEKQVWKEIFLFFGALYAGCVWQAIIPVSIVLSLLLPALLSWLIYDGLFSPIGLSMLLFCPFKFVPWANCVWFL